MMTNSLTYVKDLLHAQLCFQLFITPIHLPLEKKYRILADKACEFIEGKRSEVIHQDNPRHHVLHRFAPKNKPDAKKILITHGWISRAAYMVRLIRFLHQQGYDVYALDFPAHGDAKGIQLNWTEATIIIKEILNTHGPFSGVIGHSFGGSMILNSLNLAGQLPEFQLKHNPERAVLIASPTRMSTPIDTIARRFKLSGNAYHYLRHMIQEQTEIDLNLIQIKNFVDNNPKTPFLCIHGDKDETVDLDESLYFCNAYKNARLSLLNDADHVSVLFDDRVEQLVFDFLEQ